MDNIYFIVAVLIAFNSYVTKKVLDDAIYFLINEKLFYIILIWSIPLIGGFLSIYRLHVNKEFYFIVPGVIIILKFIVIGILDY